jgi:hypothetical protein
MVDISFDAKVNDYPPDSLPANTPLSQSTVTAAQTSMSATAATTTSKIKSTRRIVSNASIADPTQDSAGGARVWASNEKASDIFANILTRHIISAIWPDGITVDWVQGRNGHTKLAWSSKYFP